MAGSIKLYGPSGYTEIAADVDADDNVLTLPSTGTTLATDVDLATKLNIAGGKILQIVRATDSTRRSTTSTTYVDVTGMSVTITPQKSDSSILIIASWEAIVAPNSSTFRGIFSLTNSSNNQLTHGSDLFFGRDDSASSAVSWTAPLQAFGWDTPATTSATTYKMRFRVDNSSTTVSLRNDGTVGLMLALEISA